MELFTTHLRKKLQNTGSAEQLELPNQLCSVDAEPLEPENPAISRPCAMLPHAVIRCKSRLPFVQLLLFMADLQDRDLSKKR
jgi:hypothetical protein